MNRRAFGERLKALRQQKSWAQEVLAEKLGVERNTVNRWEMGHRAPALTMIERIAAALGVTVEAVLPDLAADRGRGPLAVPARIVTFDPGVLARHPAAGPLLGLMAIVNEVRTLRRLLIVSQEQMRGGPTAAEQAIYAGESGSFFRSLCALLFEAGDAVDQLERKSPGLLDGVARGNAKLAAALKAVRGAYAKERAAGDKGFLRAVRNWTVRHYDAQYFQTQLAKGVNAKRVPGEVVLTPHAGLGRYTITDELATHVIRAALRVDLRDFQARFYEKFGEIIALSEALAFVVDYAVEHLVQDHVTRTEESALRVDPLIARARRAVAVERAKQTRAR